MFFLRNSSGAAGNSHGLHFTDFLFLSFLLLALVGCDNDEETYEAVTEKVVLINAIPDSPTLTATLYITDGSDGDVTERNIGLSYQLVSSQTIEIYDVSMEVTYVDPETESTVTLINEVELNLSADTIHTVILTGTYAAPDFIFLTTPEGDIEDSDDEMEMRILNVSSVDPITVSLTGNEDDTITSNTLTPGNATDVFNLDTDQSYVVGVTNSAATDLIDITDLGFSAGTRRMIIIADKEITGGIELFVVNDLGSSTTYQNLLVPPRLRITNALPIADSLEFTITDSFTEELVRTLTLDYGATSDYTIEDLSTVFLNVGFDDPDTGNPVRNIVSLDQDGFYTFVLGGSATETSTHLFEIEERDRARRAIFTLVNGAEILVSDDDDDEEYLELSFYILQNSESLEDVSPQASSLDFMEHETVTVDALPSIIVATEAGTNTIVAGPTPVLVEDKSSILITAIEAPGGGLPLSFSVKTRED